MKTQPEALPAVAANDNASPTRDQSAAYQAMFDWFNAQLFGGELPPVILNFSRLARALGFFAPKRWEPAREQSEPGARRHEISLNPAALKTQTLEQVTSTLVHEMAHLWQEEFGEPSRTGYHNREWAKKMEAIGLVPSSTGKPGGAKTGQRMGDYPAEGGPFLKALAEMPKECLLPWTCSEPTAERGASDRAKKNKVKYTCECGNNAWGKPGLNLLCADCEEPYEQAG